MATEKKSLGTIDLTPTWRAIVPLLIEGLTNGTPEGNRIAREELHRMAGLADKYVESQKEQ